MINNDETHCVKIFFKDVPPNTVVIEIHVDEYNITDNLVMATEIEGTPAIYLLLEFLDLVMRNGGDTNAHI